MSTAKETAMDSSLTWNLQSKTAFDPRISAATRSKDFDMPLTTMEAQPQRTRPQLPTAFLEAVIAKCHVSNPAVSPEEVDESEAWPHMKETGLVHRGKNSDSGVHLGTNMGGGELQRIEEVKETMTQNCGGDSKEQKEKEIKKELIEELRQSHLAADGGCACDDAEAFADPMQKMACMP
jgi:hypothetical protein